jgi:hypothetical protein
MGLGATAGRPFGKLRAGSRDSRRVAGATVVGRRSARCSRSAVSADDAFWAIRLRTGIGDAVALTVEADDEHGASVAVAGGLTGREDRRFAAPGGHVANALSEATMAEFVGAAEEINGVFGAVGRESQFHGAVVLVAEGQDVRPHAKRV